MTRTDIISTSNSSVPAFFYPNVWVSDVTLTFFVSPDGFFIKTSVGGGSFIANVSAIRLGSKSFLSDGWVKLPSI